MAGKAKVSPAPPRIRCGCGAVFLRWRPDEYRTTTGRVPEECGGIPGGNPRPAGLFRREQPEPKGG
ncbi:MAG: hypothetical protein K2O69_07230 [Odoribacter sp.]|nr:hypothetical protein [Odoribacter sp.]